MAAQALINIDVDDLGRGVSFYSSAFGLKVGRRLGRFAVELLGAGCPIYLLERAGGSQAVPQASERRRYDRHWTPIHLDFVVDDVDRAVDAAMTLGATLEVPAQTHVWGRIAQLADPFGHGLCIMAFLGRGYDEVSSE